MSPHSSKLPVIKFSHLYQKVLDAHNDMIETAVLLEVLRVNLEDLHPAFLEYDTDAYKYTRLPKKGQYLLLLFLKPPTSPGITDANLLTTLRRETPDKYTYYLNLRGREFEVRYTPETPTPT